MITNIKIAQDNYFVNIFKKNPYPISHLSITLFCKRRIGITAAVIRAADYSCSCRIHRKITHCVRVFCRESGRLHRVQAGKTVAFQHRTHDDRHHIRNDNEAWSDRRSGRTHHLESSVPDHVLPEVQDCGTRFQGLC